MYFSDLYRQCLFVKRKNLYGRTPVKIPTPRYFVFYNGNDEMPDQTILKLSDAFELQAITNLKGHKPLEILNPSVLLESEE